MDSRQSGLRILALTVLLAASPAAMPGNPHDISWQERDGRILHPTVCFNHPYGSTDFRRCKNHAKDHFKQRCAELTDKWRATRYPQRLRYRDEREKFCHSARTYRIN